MEKLVGEMHYTKKNKKQFNNNRGVLCIVLSNKIIWYNQCLLDSCLVFGYESCGHQKDSLIEMFLLVKIEAK